MVDTYTKSMGLVMDLYVASIVFFCYPHVVGESCYIVVHAFV